MKQAYLVTGFLGAGKTSFLKSFCRCFPDQRIFLVINEFGREGVDGALLADQGTELKEINHGSIFCACKAEDFARALDQFAASDCDLAIIEASGLADPTDIGKILARDCYSGIDYQGAVCVIDALRFHKVWETARNVKKQVAVATGIVINKIDLAEQSQIDDIMNIMKSFRPGIPILQTSYGQVDKDFVASLPHPAEAEAGEAAYHAPDITLSKLTLWFPKAPLVSLKGFLSVFIEDSYRVKGFLSLEEGIFLVDCVGPILKVEPFRGEVNALGCLNVLYGNGLPVKRSLKKAIALYPQLEIRMEAGE